jgi:hypothetical protein
MGVTDFNTWVAPDLTLTLRGRSYTKRTPSVEEMGMILAAAVRAEVNLELVDGPIPVEIQEVLDTIGDKHPALGDAYEQMVADNVAPYERDRMAYYAVFYWARGKDYADRLAKVLWSPRDLGEFAAGGEAVPKD